MDRRRFLARTAASAAALAFAPGFIRKAFGDAACPTGTGPDATPKPKPESAVDVQARAEATVRGGLERAGKGSRPLVVLVVPADDGKKYDRGSLFGEWLNHGSDAQLAPLGQAEVVAAPLAAVKAIVGDAPGGDPLLLVVDPATKRVRALEAKVPAPAWAGRRGLADPAAHKAELAASDKRIKVVADLAASALPSVPAGRDKALADDVRARIVQQRVPGAHWAQSGGCGSRVEDDPEDVLMPACGMGHVPARASRFLYLFAETPGEAQRKWREAEKKKTKTL